MVMLLNSAYAMIDLAWVGSLGEPAVAGLSISLQAFFIILAIAQIIATTALADISQAYGRGEVARAGGLASSFTIVALGVGVASATIAYLVADHYVGVFTDDPEVFVLGVSYFQVTALTFFTQLLLMVFGNCMRGSGDFVTPMRIMIVSVLINVALDPLLIFGWGPFPELGLAGAAWATVIAQTVACLSYARRFIRPNADPQALVWRRPEWSRGLFRRILVRGLPAGVQFFLLSLVLGIVLAAVKPFGAIWTATAGGGFRVLQQTFLPLVALGSASAAISGQNLGARQPERVREVVRTALTWGMLFAVVAASLLFFGGAFAARIFASEPDAIALGAEYFRWTAPSLIAFCATYIPTFVLQAAGWAILPLVSATVRVGLLLLLITYVIPTFGLDPIFIFGAVAATAFVEGTLDVLILHRFLVRTTRRMSRGAAG